MGARCETEGKHLVTIFRSLIAKELINFYQLTQVEAAKKIGTTQAAVSQYIRSKRAKNNIMQCKGLLPQIQTLANKTAQRLAKGEINWEQASLDFCKACSKNFVEEIELTADHYVI